MSDSNYPSKHKHYHNNEYHDITITDTDTDPIKHIDVTFHSGVGGSLTINLTKNELSKLTDAAQDYLAGDEPAQGTPENYSYCLDADKVREHINSLIYDTNVGIIYTSEEDRYALGYFTTLDDEVQKKLASQALHQVIEIEDNNELFMLGENTTNDAARYVIDYIKNNDI